MKLQLVRDNKAKDNDIALLKRELAQRKLEMQRMKKRMTANLAVSRHKMKALEAEIARLAAANIRQVDAAERHHLRP